MKVERHRCEMRLWKSIGNCRKCGFHKEAVYICVAAIGCKKRQKVQHVCLGKEAKR